MEFIQVIGSSFPSRDVVRSLSKAITERLLQVVTPDSVGRFKQYVKDKKQ